MEATTTQLVKEIATTTGLLIQGSFPIWILFFGSGLALVLTGAIILAITRAFKKL